MSKPSILVSNDDGIHSPGLHALAEALDPLGEVTVVAPDRERSASGHAMSLHRPLRLRKVAPRRFACDGTPTDSVYVGVHHVLSGRLPNLLVSGINMGANMADDITYSGTLAAAFEGTIIGIPSVAISLTGRSPWNFDAAAGFARSLARTVLEKGLPEGVLLNVNVPPGSPGGYRITRQGSRRYSQTIEERQDPRGEKYFWIGGPGQDHEDIPLSDCNAVIDDSVISVTPLHLDLTAVDAMEPLRSWSIEGFPAH
ncbi:MAG: 5'/3'-nucleotidase SurE [Myxococcota bacterium]